MTKQAVIWLSTTTLINMTSFNWLYMCKFGFGYKHLTESIVFKLLSTSSLLALLNWCRSFSILSLRWMLLTRFSTPAVSFVHAGLTLKSLKDSSHNQNKVNIKIKWYNVTYKVTYYRYYFKSIGIWKWWKSKYAIRLLKNTHFRRPAL